MVTMRRLFSWLTVLALSRLLLMGCVVPGSYSVILKRRRHRFLQSLARHFRARKPDRKRHGRRSVAGSTPDTRVPNGRPVRMTRPQEIRAQVRRIPMVDATVEGICRACCLCLQVIPRRWSARCVPLSGERRGCRSPRFFVVAR